MTKYRGFLSSFSLLLLVFFVSSLAWAKSDQSKPSSWLNQPPPLQTDPVSTDETILDVFITDEGIFPPVLTISPGMTIQWTNQSSQTQRLAGSSTASATTIYLPLIFKASDNQSSGPVSNESANSSNITGQETNWQSGEILPGDSFSLVFSQSGEYPYTLIDAPSLSGTIVVELSQMAGLGASTLIVTTLDDELNNNDKCSLREAITAANTNKAVGACPAGSSYEDTIMLGSGTHVLTLPGKNEDAAATGDLDIKSKIKIVGASDGQTTIDASGLSDRVFHILGYGTATISKVTIQKGSNYGGGIYNVGTLTLNHSNILSNTAGSSFGGGLKNDGYATVNNSAISGNSADYGGGVFNRGTLSLNNVTVSGNTADHGGGIKNQGTLKLNNSTISNNNAADGGGVFNFSYGQVKFQNTIIAGNTAGNSQRADCAYFSSGSLGFNLIGIGTGCPTGGSGIVTVNPSDVFSDVLDLLQDNGGNTLTHALRPGSPAIDAGNPDGCKDSSGSLLTTDQRGEKRPVDGNNDKKILCDIGAYEAKPANPAQTSPYIINISTDTNDGVCTQANCSLREAVNAANGHPNGDKPDEIRFSIPSSGLQTIQLTSTLVITDPLIIDGTTQPGATCNPLNPLIRLDGTNAGPTADGLNITGGNSTVRGLIISNFKGDGIELSSSGNNIIRCNIITNNGDPITNNGAGIRVSTSISNTIGGTGILSDVNRIADNTGLGLDLGGNKVTPNDPGDADTGPNNLQNFPVLTGAFPDGNNTRIEGRLNSTANTPFTLEFFVNPICDASSFGEGQTFLGAASVQTDDTGDAVFTNTVSFPVAVPLGQFITAMATGPDGTSEFSQCVPVSLDNDSWPTAHRLTPTATISQFLDKEGQSRWYKFTIQPNSQVIVTLTGLTSTVLPGNYDLTIYKDIEATFNELISPTVQDLVQLNAEFASDAFASDAVARASRSPDAIARASRSPEAFAAAAFSPDAIARASRSPDAFARASRSPDAFAADAFAPDAYSPDALARASRSPDAIARASRSPEAFSSAQTLSLLGISAFEGTSGEGLIVNTWNNTGDFYVRVKGRNGAFSLDAPFRLQVELSGNSCSGINPISPTPISAAGPGFKTIILTDLDRMEGSAADRTALLASLDTFKNQDEVAGVVVNVGDFQRVDQLNAQADAHPECPYAKNLVAWAIKDIVTAYRNANSELAYVVIIGNDEVIPFFRYPDRALLGPESDYIPPVDPFTASEASLRLDYVLGQDEYGSQVDLSVQSSTLPIPDLAVGRLVETMADVKNMLDIYPVATNGVVNPASALVTGYDFFADAAEQIQGQLESGISGTADTLISARNVSPLDEDNPNDPSDPFAWTADQLRAQLGVRHDVIFLGGHFSASSALAADYQSRLLSTDLTSSPVNLENALIFSIGCHSGYNIVNNHGIPGVTAEPDWAQAFARKGATFIGGTGYQYGDTDFLEYSERIYLEFSRQLRTGSGAVSIGQALVKAKQIYLAQTPQLRPLHEKSLLEATLFGLPMLSINMPGTRLSPPSDNTIISSVSDAPAATLGLKIANISLNPTLSQSTVDLQDIDDLDATVEALYLSGDSGVLSNPGEPILPLLVRNVTVTAPDNLVLRGVGFRGGSYNDIPNVRALTGAPTTEIRSVHTPFLSDIFYPTQQWSVNYFEALANQNVTTRLAVTPAQFKSTSPGSETNTLRQYSDMNFRLYYSNHTAPISVAGGVFTPSLAAAPVIAKVSAPITPTGVVNFKIRVIGDPVAGIQEVWVTYTSGCLANDVCNGTWQSLDLTQDAADTTLWTGTLPGTNPANVRYIVQAANGVGLVSMATNMGAYYIPGIDEIQLDATALSLDTPGPTSGPYGTEATFSAVLRDKDNQPLSGQVVIFGLGSQSGIGITNGSGQASAKIPLLGTPGAYEVRAAFAGNGPNAASAAPNTFQFEIKKQGTNLCLEKVSDSNDDNCVLESFTVSGVASDDALLVATLKDATGRRLFEKNVVFVVTGSGAFSQSVTVITDFLGRAPLGNLLLPPGDYTVKAYFNGSIPLSTGQTVNLEDAHYFSSSSQTASLTLQNISPVAGNDAYEVDEDTVLNVPTPGVLGNDSDVDSPTLTAVLATSPSHGILTLNLNGSFIYTPTANFNGLDSFTYRASDGNSNSSVATVTITVKPANDAPKAVNDAYSVNEGSVLTVSPTGVLSNDIDVDLDPLTAILVTGPSKGTLTLNSNGSFTYKPQSKFYGTDSFTYKANDGTVNSNIATVTIMVNPTICSQATANPITIWPPNKDLWVPESVNISNSIAVTITRIFQDEPIGKGKYSPDGYILGPNSAKIRAERDGNGNGRVYHLQFTAIDTQGISCSGEVLAGIVPHNQNGTVENVDSGPPYYDSKTGAVIP